MIDQLRTHRTAMLVSMVVTVILSLVNVLQGDIETALLPWALPAAMLIGLAWEARQRP